MQAWVQRLDRYVLWLQYKHLYHIITQHPWVVTSLTSVRQCLLRLMQVKTVTVICYHRSSSREPYARLFDTTKKKRITSYHTRHVWSKRRDRWLLNFLHVHSLWSSRDVTIADLLSFYWLVDLYGVLLTAAIRWLVKTLKRCYFLLKIYFIETR